MKLVNNTILVTGGTEGFGFEFASKFIALGNTVIITGKTVIMIFGVVLIVDALMLLFIFI